jgi:NhaD family Na+/H+ antiporter
MEYLLSEQFLLILVFVIGYLGIVFEHKIQVNKTATALLMATISWAILFIHSGTSVQESLDFLGKHLSSVSQIILFLLGAMTIVELIDSHKGFKIFTEIINTRSKKKMLWFIGAVSFFLSAILDNLTTTIVMVSLLRKLIPEIKDRMILGSIVVIAANAGGAWTPIGDVTTTMLWINGQITSWPTMKSLFLPSVLSLVIALVFFAFQFKGQYPALIKKSGEDYEPGAKSVLFCGMGALVAVPLFKALTGLPPFMGMLIGLGFLWLLTDLMHHNHDGRKHLKVPYILTKVDTSSILFFLGILLSINALETVGILDHLALFLGKHIHSLPLIATSIGIVSAVVDNVPLVAATMGMYDLNAYPIDSSLWQMIAYAAGTGGSVLIIGSAAGVALMGLEKIDFIWYLRKVSLIALIGYLSGMGVYVLLKAFVPGY